MKILGALLFLMLILSSCSNPEKQKTVQTPKKSNKKLTLEQMIPAHIERDLGIGKNEKYLYKINKADLDGDDKIDAIITVCRKDFAISEASKSKNPAKVAQIGYVGNYNYIFYFDGGLNQISPSIIVPSSPLAELVITFENIHSEIYKDILIDYRILDASYKDFFTVINHTPQKYFQWKNFSGLNNVTKEAYYFEYEPGTVTQSKDIVVKKASFKQEKPNVDLYTYTPQLIKSNEILYRFFYLPAKGKYVTQRK